MSIIRIKTTHSTNLLLQELAGKEMLEEGTVVLAGEQTAGRGQRNSHWEAAPGKNITCSILFYPTFLPLKQHFLLSKVIALGIKDTLNTCCVPCTIKYPNDIYFGDRKIAGILIENEITGQEFSQSIAGIGLNVNQEHFVSDAPNPISLKQITGKHRPLLPLAEKLLRHIYIWYIRLQNGEWETIAEAYHNALYRREGFHCYEDKNGRFRATIRAVSNDGYLHLITEEGEERSYAFKEVAWV